MPLPPSPFELRRTGRDEVLSECYLAYVDAHGRLPDRLRIDSDMRPPTASPARTALPAAYFERNDVTIVCEVVH